MYHYCFRPFVNVCTFIVYAKYINIFSLERLSTSLSDANVKTFGKTKRFPKGWNIAFEHVLVFLRIFPKKIGCILIISCDHFLIRW